jgi:hypothetical protein
VIRAKQAYAETPGLVLTTRQARRLWNLDAGVCQGLLPTIVHEELFVPDARLERISVEGDVD